MGAQSSSGGEQSTTQDCSKKAFLDDFESIEVSAKSKSGELSGSLTAALATTPEERYTGLSETTCLPTGKGMLFVFEDSKELTFVMRNMAFPIDIIFLSPGKRVTVAHQANKPKRGEDGTEPKHQYSGTGQYVLETRYNWTEENEIAEGTQFVFDIG
jgi:uncharacterized membrane protein (UPF0127 family)